MWNWRFALLALSTSSAVVCSGQRQMRSFNIQKSCIGCICRHQVWLWSRHPRTNKRQCNSRTIYRFLGNTKRKKWKKREKTNKHIVDIALDLAFSASRFLAPHESFAVLCLFSVYCCLVHYVRVEHILHCHSVHRLCLQYVAHAVSYPLDPEYECYHTQQYITCFQAPLM